MTLARRSIFLVALTLALAAAALLGPSVARADDQTALSNYWRPSISRWASLIDLYATQQGVDPNFVAAIMTEESKGDPNIVSTAGAVGLLQLMPYEAGFTWRPKTAVLKDPAQNLSWGTQTISQIIRQAQGRLRLALLAYNGGWGQIQLRAPRIFAGKVLDHYARSILTDAGIDLKQLEGWTMIIAAHSSAGPVQADQIRSDGRAEPLLNFDSTFNPPDAPHAVAFAAIDSNHIAWWVDVWVFPILNDSGSLNTNTARAAMDN
jgi:hypothetical protein